MRVAFVDLITMLALSALTSLAPPLARQASAEPPAEAAAEGQDEAAARNFDPRIAELINRAIDEMEKERYDEAREVLDRINLRRARPFEVAWVEQIYATIDQSQEKYASAREHLGRALASGGLTDSEDSAVRFQVARLLLAEERWAEGIALLEEWFAKESAPNSAAYYTLAIAYYQVEDLDKALTAAQKAIELAGENPQESWLQLLVALRLRRQEYALAYPLLLSLIERSPGKKTYWVQASMAALSTENYDDAAAVLQLADTGDLLIEANEIQLLAELLMLRGIPHRAALLLEQAIADKRLTPDAKSFELLSNCWIVARDYEKAIEPLTRASDLDTTGELYVRLAQLYAQQEDWSGAVDALQRGIKKGNLKQPGLAALLMGMAQFNQKKLPEARVWFQRAAAHREQKEHAEAWLDHTEKTLAASTS